MFKNMQEVKECLDRKIDVLLESFGIKLIYIFGSFAKGTNRENSDLDIAILLEDNYSPLIKLQILDELVGIFHIENIDLVILNNVNEVLKFQVIKYGKVLYMKDLTTKVLFEAHTMSEYMDMEHFRNIQNEYSRKKFLDVMGE